MRQHNDLEWIRHPEWWMNIFGPVCTVKRSTSVRGMEVGIIYPDDPLAVKVGTIDRHTDTLRYPSAETILADGWRVD